MSILNAANNALRGVTNVLGGSPAQPNVNVLGTNIPGIPLVSFRNYFITSMSSWIGTIPLRTQWIVLFDSFPVGLNSDILRGLEPVQGDRNAFDIDRARTFLTGYTSQGIAGCIFAQGATIPDDTSQSSVAAISNNRGFIPGVISGNRSQFSPLILQFRETNTSFTDCVIRPWVILGSHAGMVARDANNKPDLDPRTNITIIHYTRSYQHISQIPRKIWKFYNCVPTSIDTRNLTYDAESLEQFSTSWSYSHYNVSDNLYLPLPDLLDKFL